VKYVCDACERLVEPSAVRAAEAIAYLRCPKCGSESSTAVTPTGPQTLAISTPAMSAAPAPVAPPADRPLAVASVQRPEGVAPQPATVAAAPVPPEERCPKCATAKDGRDACRKCGLVFALYNPEHDVVPQSARRDFDQLLDSWGTPESARLLAGLPVESVPHVGRLCRHRLADAPGDPRASGLLQKLQERMLAFSAAATQSDAIAREGGATLSTRGALAAIVVLALIVGLAVLLSLAHAAG
jgi:rubredoxin